MTEITATGCTPHHDSMGMPGQERAVVTCARPWVVLYVVIIQMGILNSSVGTIVLALTPMSKELHVDVSTIMWVYFMPSLVSGMLSIPLGRLSDGYSRRSLWFLGNFLHVLG